VRPVVLDTSVALPAVLSPRGYRRRLLVLLAFGALAARRELAHSEAQAMRTATQPPTRELGGPSAETLAHHADARYQRLAAHMPPGCPEHWRMIGSQPLLDEYHRKLDQAGPKLDPALDAHRIEIASAQLQAACATITDSFDPTLIPRYSTDRDDDAIIHTALLANAAWLISDDRKHISTNPDGITEYHLPDHERHISAVTFSTFTDLLTDVDLDHIDPTLLATAFADTP